MLGRLPEVLHTGLYAIPALITAAIVVMANLWSSQLGVFEVLAAGVCFGIRRADVRLKLNAADRPRSRRDGRRPRRSSVGIGLWSNH